MLQHFLAVVGGLGCVLALVREATLSATSLEIFLAVAHDPERGAEAARRRRTSLEVITRHSHQRAIERAAAVIIKVADRYSSDELDTALKTARRAIQFSLKETSAEVNVGRTLIEMIDAARSIARNRA